MHFLTNPKRERGASRGERLAAPGYFRRVGLRLRTGVVGERGTGCPAHDAVAMYATALCEARVPEASTLTGPLVLRLDL